MIVEFWTCTFCYQKFLELSSQWMSVQHGTRWASRCSLCRLPIESWRREDRRLASRASRFAPRRRPSRNRNTLHCVCNSYVRTSLHSVTTNVYYCLSRREPFDQPLGESRLTSPNADSSSWSHNVEDSPTNAAPTEAHIDIHRQPHQPNRVKS